MRVSMYTDGVTETTDLLVFTCEIGRGKER